MGENNVVFELVLHKAVNLPQAHIDREDFLRKELRKKCTAAQLETAIQYNPAYAGINRETIDKIADSCIKYETNKASALSFAAGLPGGVAVAAAAPADVVQYMVHMLRILQKLAYLYGWDEIVHPSEELDDETMALLTLLMGVMLGVTGAEAVIRKIADSAARKANKALLNKALAHGALYPIVRKTAQILGIRLSEEVFAKSASKVIPLVGGVASGGLTYFTFKPCAERLRKQLSQLQWCDVEYYEQTAFDEGFVGIHTIIYDAWQEK